jgi:FMN phosphatase YigB (HAD superfamily)
MSLLNGFVDVWVLSYEVGHIKPDAEIYRFAAARLGLPAAAILMVGDTVRDDYDGARAPGFDAVVLDLQRRHSPDIPFERLHGLADLASYVAIAAARQGDLSSS